MTSPVIMVIIAQNKVQKLKNECIPIITFLKSWLIKGGMNMNGEIIRTKVKNTKVIHPKQLCRLLDSYLSPKLSS